MLFLLNHAVHSVIKPCASKFQKGVLYRRILSIALLNKIPIFGCFFFNNEFFLTLGTEVCGDRWLQVCSSVDYIHL